MSNEKDYEKELKNFDSSEAIKGKEKHFSENKYVAKLLKYAKKMGVKISYYSLLLFYAFKNPATPKSTKVTIAGALGYLILPIDLIPDFIPVAGFADDAMVIVYALSKIKPYIDDSIKQQADERMRKIFGENYDGDNEIEENFKPQQTD
ncbi:YkvA family protein [Halobacillus shinanisalinarum]|uniref:YkvA family protein n=1 Tax=Halobacillus shinanisalinarum TaxID=2932258 RepID=A0ABY4GWK7_9BACI|nr:YkvA family protein [Halobacillus shinanisalinarum]UOQ92386.1 YkvA family protein [Halobacillus shinanisalinarum]